MTRIRPKWDEVLQVLRSLCRLFDTANLQHLGSHSPIPVMPRNAGSDIGPLMMGVCAGADSGAGIRFSKVGIRGAGDPKRRVGLRTKAPRPAPAPNPPPI